MGFIKLSKRDTLEKSESMYLGHYSLWQKQEKKKLLTLYFKDLDAAYDYTEVDSECNYLTH